MRVVGPNCLGIANTDPAVRLERDVRADRTGRGECRVPLAVGRARHRVAQPGRGAGDRHLRVRLGRQQGRRERQRPAPVLGRRPATDVVLLYLESFGNPRKFARLARRISLRKPIVAVKSGRTPAGSRAASSHTAALASSDVAVDALFRQAGVIRVDTLEELLDTAQLLATQPVPARRTRRDRRQRRRARASWPPTPATAPASMSSELSPPRHDEVRALVTPGVTVCNPIDLGAAATPEHVRARASGRARRHAVDAVIVIYASPVVTDAGAVARAIADVGAPRPRPTSRWSRASSAGSTSPTSSAATVSRAARSRCSRSPKPRPARSAASRGLGGVARAARGNGRRRSSSSYRSVDVDGARALIADRLDRQMPDAAISGWTRPIAARCCARSASRRSSRGGSRRRRRAAAAGGGRLAGGAQGRVGRRSCTRPTWAGWCSGSHDPDAVGDAFDEMSARFGDDMDGAVVQRMAPPGLEVIVGVTQDPLFGPLLLFGLGGVTAELLADRALRILPVTDEDAHELVRSLRTSPLLFGYRGSPALDAGALEELIVRVGPPRARSARDHRDGPEPDHRAREGRGRGRREGALRTGPRVGCPPSSGGPATDREPRSASGDRARATRRWCRAATGRDRGVAAEHPGPFDDVDDAVPAVALEAGRLRRRRLRRSARCRRRPTRSPSPMS